MIELIMVIVLVGVLSFYAQSKFETGAFEERFFADDLVSALRFAQKFSLSSGCQVQFSLTASGFSLVSDGECETNNAVNFNQNVLRPWAATAFVNQEPVPDQLTYQDGSSNTITTKTIVFYPQGWACSANGNSTSVEMIVLVGSSTTRSINVVCSTGFVYVT